MEEKGVSKIIFAHNYWCISCASLQGLRVTADYVIWDDEDEKMIPLCHYCHEAYIQKPEFFDVFSVN